MFDLSILLIYILLSPVIGALVLLFIFSTKNRKLKWLAMFWFSQPVIGSSILLWSLFKSPKDFCEVKVVMEQFSFFQLSVSFGLDSSSCCFLIIGSLTVLLCVLAMWTSIAFKLKEFLIIFLLLEFFLVSYLSILDVIVFYDIFGYSGVITHVFSWSMVISFIVR